LTAASRKDLLAQAALAAQWKPDLIEWRVDAYEALGDIEAVGRTLAALSAGRRSLPLLFTCRAPAEGGVQALAADMRLDLYRMACASGLVDLIDLELASGPEMIRPLQGETRAAGVKMILSYHDFDRTPDGDILLEKLQAAEQAGADIAKIAVMPANCQDVLTLLGAACEARLRHLQIPLIAIAMGVDGRISRVFGGQFGSDITFASCGAASAPGQLSIEDLRKAWKGMPWMNPPEA
jgi:3-dehydroquinate dehydratase-1